MPETQLTAILLAGGKGERLGDICKDIPKPMVKVAGNPFIEHIVQYLEKKGVKKFVFLTGYLGNVIEDYFTANNPTELSFTFIREKEPLGTGGAVANAINTLDMTMPFLLLNGDSFAPCSFRSLAAAATGCHGSLVALPAPKGQRYGYLQHTSNLLTGFSEKQSTDDIGPSLINGGIYYLSPALFDNVDDTQPHSIERDLFPAWIELGKKFMLFESKTGFLDIGTPESLAQADEFILKLKSNNLL